jgi:Kdo2-lipid IVA lauroyltransferase/acyltransferase
VLRKAKHYVEAAVVHLLFTALRQFSLDSASTIGGLMARSVGPYLSAHKTARENLKIVFPKLSRNEQNKLLDKMWDHLGRVAAELSYLQNEAIVKRIKINGVENLPAHGKPAFMFSGHIGNWELLSCVSQTGGRAITGVYREANNPIVDDIITKIRAPRYVNLIPKGTQGAVKIARSIKNNEAIALLVDQKMNDGIPIPFFGRDAMTASAIAELALRYDAPIIPARVMRTKGANFEGTIYPALSYQKSGDKEKDVYNIMLAINQTLESWIRESPEQWFWVHKRWPKA